MKLLLAFSLGFFGLAGASQVHACALSEPQGDYADNHRQPGPLGTDREAPLPEDLVLVFGDYYMDSGTLYEHKDEWRAEQLFSQEQGAFHIGVRLDDERFFERAFASWGSKQKVDELVVCRRGEQPVRPWLWYEGEKLYDFISRFVVSYDVQLKRKGVGKRGCMWVGTKLEGLFEHPKSILSIFCNGFLKKLNSHSETGMMTSHSLLRGALDAVIEEISRKNPDFKRTIEQALADSEREMAAESIVAFLQAHQQKGWDARAIIEFGKRIRNQDQFAYEVFYAKAKEGMLLNEAYPHFKCPPSNMEQFEKVWVEACAQCGVEDIGASDDFTGQKGREMRKACARARFQLVSSLHKRLFGTSANDSGEGYLAKSLNICFLSILFFCLAKPLYEAYFDSATHIRYHQIKIGVMPSEESGSSWWSTFSEVYVSHDVPIDGSGAFVLAK